MNKIPSVDFSDFISDDAGRKQKFVNEIEGIGRQRGYTSFGKERLKLGLIKA